MKIRITVNDLKTMAKGFAKIINGKSTLPVLGQVQIAPNGDIGLKITATNLDETLTYKLPQTSMTDIAGENPFLFPFNEFKHLAQTLKKDEAAEFAVTGPGCVQVTTTVNGQSLSREIFTILAEEFPAVNELTGGVAVNMEEFLAAYRLVLKAASPELVKMAMSSVFYEHTSRTLVGSDGRRLLLLPVPGCTIEADMILPPHKLLANGILDGKTGNVTVQDENTLTRVQFETGPWIYRLKCPDVQYPNYRQVIPAETSAWAGEVQVHNDDMPALRSMLAQIADPGDPNTSVALFADTATVAVIHAGKINGDGKRPFLVLPHSKAQAEHPFVCTLNARFMLDGLDSGCTRIRYIDRTTPLRFDNGLGGIYVLMPLREVAEEVFQFVGETFHAAFPAANIEETTDMKNKKEEVPFRPVPEVSQASAPAAAESAVPVEAVIGNVPETTAAAPAMPAGNGQPALQVVPEADPVEVLQAELANAQDKAAELVSTLKGFRQKIRSLERYFRNRAKEIEAKSQIITRFQKAVSF